eukprot:TRINITY_DN23629_c0_g1_i1.p1 TRINITY_DN23629_c0_g1~~TRINITY_DN23629_c0_g1_i1.p1  ORF type:complete len:138 (+),score=9.62 TRINITY_DN23629_c0_g1_i1:69-482(+)
MRSAIPWSVQKDTKDMIVSNQKAVVAEAEDEKSFLGFLKVVEKCTNKCGADYYLACHKGIPPHSVRVDPPAGYPDKPPRETSRWLLSQGALKDAEGKVCTVYGYGDHGCVTDCIAFQAALMEYSGAQFFKETGREAR